MAVSRGTLLAPLVAAAVIVGTGVGLVLLTDGGAEPPAVATTRPPQEPATTTVSRTTVTLPPGAGIVGQWEEPLPLPPMGIETIVFDWQVTELEGDAAEAVWISDVLAFDGELWVVVGRSDWELETETTTAWTSLDGVEWTEKALPEALAAAGPPEFTVTDEALVAVGERWIDGVPQLQVFVTTDGETWTEGDLSALHAAAARLTFPVVAASPDGIVVAAGSVETFAGEPAEPPVITIEYDGYTVILDEADWSFQLLDPSAELIVEGGQELIWDSPELVGWGIFDPVSGERIFTIDGNDMWEVPIEAYEEAVFGEPLLIQLTSGERTATLDEYTGVVTISDGTGAVVFTGPEQVLWAGPPPSFTDPDSGEVILRIPWDEWDAAYEAAFPDGDRWSATPVVLRSSDGGLTWDQAVVPEVDVNVYVAGLAFGPQGFLVIGGGEGVIEGEFRSVPIVMSSPDGVAWSVVDSDLSDGWLSGLVTIGDTYMTAQHETISASRDGITWVPAVTEAELELPLGTPHFGWAAEGDLGVFVIGRRDGHEASGPMPMVARSQGRTLTVAGSVFTVVEDASGETLFTYDESDYWAGEQPGAAVTGFKWGTGGLAIFADDGTTLFTLSHRQFDELMQDEVAMYREEPFLLYGDGSEWRSVALPDILNLDLSDIEVGSDNIVVAAMTGNFDYSVSLWVLVGTPQ